MAGVGSWEARATSVFLRTLATSTCLLDLRSPVAEELGGPCGAQPWTSEHVHRAEAADF